MRNFLSAVGVLASLATTAQKNSFTIHGTLWDMLVLPSKIYLLRDTISGGAIDSAIVRNGRYELKGTLNTPAPGWLVTTLPEAMNKTSVQYLSSPGHDMTPPGNHLAVFLDKGEINISSEQTLSNSTITGSKAQDEISAASTRLANLSTTSHSLAELYHENEEMAVYNEVAEVILKMEPMMRQDYPAYIRQHPDASINPWLLLQLLPQNQTAGYLDTLQALYTAMPPSLKASPLGAEFDHRLAMEQRSAIGHPVADVSLTDAQDQPVDLKSLKGKYVLLQFMYKKEDTQGNAFLVAELSNAAKTYKEKGLTTVAAYVESNGPATDALGIHRRGRNLLIDPNGTIIGRDLNGTKLSQTLASIFE